jgi:ABC-type nitrate/sulfonate/bicarbonate transport system substrate-binding protein
MTTGTRGFRWNIGTATAIAAIIGFSGLAQAEDHLRVAKGASRAFTFTFLDVGIETGIFKKYGLDVEASSIDGAARLHQAMVADSIDIALGAGSDIAFIAKGSPEKGIGVLATEALNMGLTVRFDGPIKGVADLKGKTIGVTSVGSLTDWFARQINYREKWNEADGVKIAALGSGDGTRAALLAGNIDGFVGSVETGYTLEAENRGRMLFTFGEFANPFITHAIYATNKLIDKNPDAVRRFLKGWYETIVYAKGHKDDVVRITMPLTGLKPDLAPKIYDVEMPMMPTDGHYNPKALDIVIQSLVDTKQVETKPDPKNLVTEKFLP